MTGTLDIPGFRPYHAKVVGKTVLISSFVRIYFGSDEFYRLGTDGFDQRIKILLPLSGERWGDPHLFDPESIAKGLWYQQWKALDNANRNPVRTYTIRSANPRQRLLSVDFVLHEHPGPAGLFAQQCCIGDNVVIIGPDAFSRHSALGIDFLPGTAHHLLLMGDETAVPAIAASMECLKRTRWKGSGNVIIEVPRADDASLLCSMVTPRRFHVAALDREHHEERGSQLRIRLRALIEKGKLSETRDDLYVWLAGESSVVRSLRRLLVTDLGLSRERIVFTGYWRQGTEEM
jgi:NADPH-dependent ferric siderophore reductase